MKENKEYLKIWIAILLQSIFILVLSFKVNR